jgi:hypothetical protein
VQAAFCIDVRSEPLRRALEAVHPGMQTLGFAGFFGLPVAYTPLATEASRPQLPGLLAPLTRCRMWWRLPGRPMAACWPVPWHGRGASAGVQGNGRAIRAGRARRFPSSRWPV